jgi:response regulator RpfG family c-di-GMP phosphodiesterase
MLDQITDPRGSELKSSSPSYTALVLSDHPDAVLMKAVLESHGFRVAKATDVASAEILCRSERFDLAVYDQHVAGALDLAGMKSPSSRPRVAVGLVQAMQFRDVVGKRLHLVLRRPFTEGELSKTVKAAYGPITADRRLNFRHEVNLKADSCNLLHRGELRTLTEVVIVNFSLTGMCLQTREMLPQTGRVHMSFVIPGEDVALRVAGTVIWAHASGRCGIKFNQLDSRAQRKLEGWLDSRFPAFT